MTELNPETNPAIGAEPEALEALDAREARGARIDWPESPGGATAQDPAVVALLDRLGALPDLPVADHGEVYAGLHDDLMEALNDGGSAE